MPNVQTQLWNLCICVIKIFETLYVLSSIREVLNYDIGKYSFANGGGEYKKWSNC